MSGLLDIMDSDQFRLGLGLLAAAGARGDGMSTGGRIQEAFNGLDAYKKQKAEAESRKMQMEQEREAMFARKQAIEQQRINQEAIRRQFMPMQGGSAMTNGQGPTLDNAANIGQTQAFDPRQFLANNPNADLSALEGAMRMNQAFNPVPKTHTLAPGSTMVREGANGTFEPAYTAPIAPKEKNPNQPFMLDDNGNIVPNTAFQAYDMGRARAGGTNVSVNTGQKGFDNTLKLRGDFRSEPIYKAHQDVQSAYSQIQQGLKMASPAGDLAGATKIMKLLDPGSVVRESELGMAMAATGSLDRLLNYSDRVIKGTKLTPSQRADFQKLADALYTESGKQYNSKRGEYQGIAERNGLSVPDVLGAGFKEVKPAKTIVKTGTYGGRKVIQYDDGSTDYAN